MVNNGAAAVKHDVCMTPERTTNTTSSRERLNGGNVTFRSTCLRGAADCARGSANLLFSVDLAKEVKYKVEQLFYQPWPRHCSQDRTAYYSSKQNKNCEYFILQDLSFWFCLLDNSGNSV